MTGQVKDADLVVVLRALFADADNAMAIVAAAPNPTAFANAEEEGPPILMANTAMMRLTERLPKDLVGRGCMTLLDAITEPAATDKLVEALNGETALRVDVWTRRLGGVPVASRWEIMPVRDETGAITQRLIIIHDMTEQRLAQQELSDLKAITRKAGHDLNNMITGLIVNLSLLNGAGFTDQQRESCLTDALDAARDGARTTRQLLDAINGRAPIDMEAVEEYHELIEAQGRERQAARLPRSESRALEQGEFHLRRRRSRRAADPRRRRETAADDVGLPRTRRLHRQRDHRSEGRDHALSRDDAPTAAASIWSSSICRSTNAGKAWRRSKRCRRSIPTCAPSRTADTRSPT